MSIIWTVLRLQNCWKINCWCTIITCFKYIMLTFLNLYKKTNKQEALMKIGLEARAVTGISLGGGGSISFLLGEVLRRKWSKNCNYLQESTKKQVRNRPTSTYPCLHFWQVQKKQFSQYTFIVKYEMLILVIQEKVWKYWLAHKLVTYRVSQNPLPAYILLKSNIPTSISSRSL